MTTESIVALVVDTRLITLYRSDGSTIEIPQGDPRVRGIIDQVMPIVEKGGVAEIDLGHVNAYQQFEEKTGGFVRLFRIAKKAVAHFLGSSETIAPTQAGTIPAAPLPGPDTPSANLSTVNEIIAHAEPVTSPRFKESDTTDEHTMVAVVGDKVIPGVESVREQFNYSSKLGSTVGMEKFLQRLGAVIDKRPHSVQDVLRFMERGDLPVADDGSIVAYKILRRGSKDGIYVDCHTGRVQQRPGSYVCVDESLVDRNRRNECSNGLHVARRGYIGCFPGDVCMLIKIAPEDVVVVPHNDPNKVRVCGYHILFKLDDDSFRKLKTNMPMTSNPEAAELLTRAITGKHPAPNQEVRITQQRGKGVVITEIVDGKRITPISASRASHVAFDDPTNTVPSVDPKQIDSEVVAKVGVKPQPVKQLITPAKETPKVPVSQKATVTKLVAVKTRAQEARELFDKGDFTALKDFKNRVKKGWHVLGFSEMEVAQILMKEIDDGED